VQLLSGESGDKGTRRSVQCSWVWKSGLWALIRCLDNSATHILRSLAWGTSLLLLWRSSITSLCWGHCILHTFLLPAKPAAAPSRSCCWCCQGYDSNPYHGNWAQDNSSDTRWGAQKYLWLLLIPIVCDQYPNELVGNQFGYVDKM